MKHFLNYDDQNWISDCYSFHQHYYLHSTWASIEREQRILAYCMSSSALTLIGIFYITIIYCKYHNWNWHTIYLILNKSKFLNNSCWLRMKIQVRKNLLIIFRPVRSCTCICRLLCPKTRNSSSSTSYWHWSGYNILFDRFVWTPNWRNHSSKWSHRNSKHP